MVETKIKRGVVDTRQLDEHIKMLCGSEEDQRILLVLTPDESRPDGIPTASAEPKDRPWVVWASFAQLDQAVDGLFDDPLEVVSERETLLLRELQKMMREEKLLEPPGDVLVVPARDAWGIYEKHSAYICQPGRRFQQVKYMAFYTDWQIKRYVPKILSVHDSIVFCQSRSGDERLDKVIRGTIREGLHREGAEHKVILLSPKDDCPPTVVLKREIRNDLLDKNRLPTPFTQGQRYVRLKDLKRAKTTRDLVMGDAQGP